MAVYPDLRYKFIRGLIQREHGQRSRSYLKNAAEWTSKAIVSLDLADAPVRSVKQASKLEGIGTEICKELRIIEASGIISENQPQSGVYCSSAAAILVALATLKDEPTKVKTNAAGHTLVPETVLQDTAAVICEERFQIVTTKDKGTRFCPALWRLSVLMSRELVKKRSLNKETVYELLPGGMEIARRLIGENLAPPSATQAAIPAPTAPSCDFLYTNDAGADGVLLLVDSQEWGGDRVGLGELARLVGQTGVTYRTQRLACGDYQWLWRLQGSEVTLPVVVERKRADDLARSLRDGRYGNQKLNMAAWRQVFTDHGVPATLKYVVEGDPRDYVVRCVDGCGALVKCGYPTLDRVMAVIRELRACPDFDLIQTDDITATADVMALVTRDLEHRVRNGDFDILLHNDPGKLANSTVNRLKSTRNKNRNTTVGPQPVKEPQVAGFQMARTQTNMGGQFPRHPTNINRPLMAQPQAGFQVSKTSPLGCPTGMRTFQGVRSPTTPSPKLTVPLAQHHSAQASTVTKKGGELLDNTSKTCSSGELPVVRAKNFASPTKSPASSHKHTKPQIPWFGAKHSTKFEPSAVETSTFGSSIRKSEVHCGILDLDVGLELDDGISDSGGLVGTAKFEKKPTKKAPKRRNKKKDVEDQGSTYITINSQDTDKEIDWQYPPKDVQYLPTETLHPQRCKNPVPKKRSKKKDIEDKDQGSAYIIRDSLDIGTDIDVQYLPKETLHPHRSMNPAKRSGNSSKINTVTGTSGISMYSNPSNQSSDTKFSSSSTSLNNVPSIESNFKQGKSELNMKSDLADDADIPDLIPVKRSRTRLKISSALSLVESTLDSDYPKVTKKETTKRSKAVNQQTDVLLSSDEGESDIPMPKAETIKQSETSCENQPTDILVSSDEDDDSCIPDTPPSETRRSSSGLRSVLLPLRATQDSPGTVSNLEVMDKVDQVLMVLPHLDTFSVKRQLIANDYDVERTVVELLD